MISVLLRINWWAEYIFHILWEVHIVGAPIVSTNISYFSRLHLLLRVLIEWYKYYGRSESHWKRKIKFHTHPQTHTHSYYDDNNTWTKLWSMLSCLQEPRKREKRRRYQIVFSPRIIRLAAHHFLGCIWCYQAQRIRFATIKYVTTFLWAPARSRVCCLLDKMRRSPFHTTNIMRLLSSKT